MDYIAALHISFLILALLRGISSLPEISCPKSCNCNKLSISCQDGKMKKLPSNFTIPPTVEVFDLSMNYFEILDKTLLNITGIYTVKTLLLNYSNVAVVSPKTFSNLTNLEHLDLSENLLETVPKSLVQYNQHIISLKLSYNIFRTTPELISQNLEVLDLSNSHLNSFGEINVINLQNLRVLYLQANHLKYISPHTFSLSHHLYYVELSPNNWICNCSTARLFANLMERNLTSIEDPIRCRLPNRKYIVMHSKEGAVYAKKSCNSATISSSESDKVPPTNKTSNNSRDNDIKTKANDIPDVILTNNIVGWDGNISQATRGENLVVDKNVSEKLIQENYQNTFDSRNRIVLIVSVVLVGIFGLAGVIGGLFLIKHRKKKEVYEMVSTTLLVDVDSQ